MNQVLVTLNQTGIDLTEDEIELLLNLDEKSIEWKRTNLAQYDAVMSLSDPIPFQINK